MIQIFKPSLLLVCFAIINVSSVFAQEYTMRGSDDRTKQRAVDLFVLVTQMEQIAQMCDETIPTEEHDQASGKALVEEKLLISFAKLQEILEEETELMQSIERDLYEYDCMFSDNRAVLKKLASDYDSAWFRLDLTRGLSEPIVSKKDYENSHEERLNKAIAEHQDTAYTIAIGIMVPLSDVPEKYRDLFWERDADYWYQFNKGWKMEAGKFAPRAKSYYYNDDEDAALTEQLSSMPHLFFINDKNIIVAQVEIKNEQDIIDRFGKPRWFYSGDELRERRH